MSTPVKKTVLLLRHGETALTSQRRFIGRTDLPLSLTGRRQAASAARLVRRQQPQCCLCSPMRRCVETASAVLARSQPKPEILADLREIDFGQWEKLTFEEIQQASPASIDRWAKFDPAFSFPDGERLGAFVSRVRRVARQIASRPQSSILVITHGGVIRALTCHFLGLPARQYMLFDAAPASLTMINLFDSGKGVLAGLTPCDQRTEK